MSEPFVFPNSLLNQIEECSNGGFVLIFVDEDKDIDIIASYDSEMVLRALVSKGKGWAIGMEKLLIKEDKENLEDFFENEQQD